MTYKSLITIFLSSLGFIGALTLGAAAQERPECYLIDNSGQLTDLSDICNVTQKRSPKTNPATSEPQNIINQKGSDYKLLNTGLELDDTVYILGANNLTSKSGLIDRSYYIDNAIGTDYTAYIRRYKTSPTSMTRQALREEIFQFNTTLSTPNRLTSILRQGRALPFIIYGY